MTTTLWLVVLAAIAMIEGWLLHWLVINDVAPRIDDWLRHREVVRRSVADHETQAMRTVEQLSLVAWKAPHDLDQPSRVTKRALAQVPGHGMVAAAKPEAAVFVTHVAIQEIGMLSMEEALLVERTPHAAARVKAIVDAFTADAVARMGYQS